LEACWHPSLGSPMPPTSQATEEAAVGEAAVGEAASMVMVAEAVC
jgi:hypothetical protein